MEFRRLIDLFERTSGHINKRSLQGNGGGSLVHTPGANPKSSLILHPLLMLLIQPKSVTSWNQPHPPTYSYTHVCLKPFTLRATFLILSMIHINLPPTHPHCTTYRRFRVISLPISFLIFSLGTCSFVTWDQFLEGKWI